MSACPKIRIIVRHTEISILFCWCGSMSVRAHLNTLSFTTSPTLCRTRRAYATLPTARYRCMQTFDCLPHCASHPRAQCGVASAWPLGKALGYPTLAYPGPGRENRTSPRRRDVMPARARNSRGARAGPKYPPAVRANSSSLP